MPFQPAYEVPRERRPYTLIPEHPTGKVGCLALHGFLGSPGSSRPLAEFLCEQGVAVHCPLLPGHGHWPDKLEGVSQSAWLREAEEAYDHMAAQYEQLFLLCHSMGSVLGAHLAVNYADPNHPVRGLIMITPLFEIPDYRLSLMPIVRHVMRWLYPHKMGSMQDLVRQRVLDFAPELDFDDPEFQREMLPRMSRLPTSGLAEMVGMVRRGRRLWRKLRSPVIIFQGGQDPAVDPEHIRKVYDALPGRDKQLEIFPQAGHELMRPFEEVHTTVWQMTLDFVQRHALTSANAQEQD